jgi:hypothetical protein
LVNGASADRRESFQGLSLCFLPTDLDGIIQGCQVFRMPFRQIDPRFGQNRPLNVT